MGIEEREDMQAKESHNIFSTIITEKFPNLKKVLPIQVQETSRAPNILHQNRTPSTRSILSLKQKAQRMESEY
jgi:hypothetical protein